MGIVKAAELQPKLIEAVLDLQERKAMLLHVEE